MPAIPSNVFEEICNRIEISSIGIPSILKKFFPKYHTDDFYDFMRNVGEDARKRYAQAKKVQAECIAEEMLDIADDGSNDLMTIVKGDKEYKKDNKEVTNRSRLRIDTR